MLRKRKEGRIECVRRMRNDGQKKRCAPQKLTSQRSAKHCLLKNQSFLPFRAKSCVVNAKEHFFCNRSDSLLLFYCGYLKDVLTICRKKTS